jgi:Tol biopolymer transport system component
MKLSPRRAACAFVLASALTAAVIAAPAQANTTLLGVNGKIAYTTNADIENVGPGTNGPAQQGPTKCFVPLPVGAEAGFGFSALFCNAEIATINPDGGGFFQVTHNDTQDDHAAWLPADGSKLAFQRVFLDKTCELCSYEVTDVTPDGATEHQLTSEPTIFQGEQPSYSPNGSQIAFEGLNPDFPLGNRLSSDPEIDQLNHLAQIIYTMPAAGQTAGAPAPLLPASETDEVEGKGTFSFVSDSQPSYSPDGTKVVFARLVITETELVIGGVAQRGQFTENVDFTSEIRTAPASGGSSTLVESPGTCSISRQAFLVALASTEAGGTATGALPPDARGGLNQCVWDAAPTWSPDGSKLAIERITFPRFQLEVDAASRGFIQTQEDSDVVTMNADGNNQVDISDVTEPADCGAAIRGETAFCSLDQEPTWSPDGKKIAFHSNRDSTGAFPLIACEKVDQTLCDDEIWTMNADGSSPFQVTSNDVNDINPDWQRIPPPVPPTPPAPPVATPAKPTVAVAGVRQACVRGAFHVRLRVGTTASVKNVVVKLDGKRLKSTSKGSFTLSINPKKLKAGRHRLTITVTDSAGQTTTSRKSFSVCKAAKPRRRSVPRFTG